jgi:hypothetical protein
MIREMKRVKICKLIQNRVVIRNSKMLLLKRLKRREEENLKVIIFSNKKNKKKQPKKKWRKESRRWKNLKMRKKLNKDKMNSNSIQYLVDYNYTQES